jgi:UDPglucose 6-dehydrogenase
MRDSPAIGIVHRLSEEGASVCAFDPVGIDQARPLLPDTVEYAEDAAGAVAEADGLVVITEWSSFRGLSPDWLAETMRGRVVVDLRNIFSPEAMREAGFSYSSIGRPAANPSAKRSMRLKSTRLAAVA